MHQHSTVILFDGVYFLAIVKCQFGESNGVDCYVMCRGCLCEDESCVNVVVDCMDLKEL